MFGLIKNKLDLFWLGMAPAVSRSAYAVGGLVLSVILEVDEYGEFGLLIAGVMVVTQTFGYSASLFFLKKTDLKISDIYFLAFVLLLSLMLYLYLYSDFSYAMFVGALFVLSNCLYQCLAAMMQSKGLYKEVVAKTGYWIVLFMIAGLLSSSVYKGLGFLFFFSLGYLISAFLLYLELKDGFLKIFDRKEIMRGIGQVWMISASGFFLSISILEVLNVLNDNGRIVDVAYFSFALMLRSAMVFVPGVLGAYFLTKMAQRKVGSEKLNLINMSLLGSLSVILIGGSIVIFISTPGGLMLPAANIDVVIYFTVATAFIALSTPYIRALSVIGCEWCNLVVAAVVSAVIYYGAYVEDQDAVFYSKYILFAFLVQYLITLLFYIWKKNEKDFL